MTRMSNFISATDRPSGLGIDLCPASAPCVGTSRTSVTAISTRATGGMPTLRSISAMKGLLLAEVGAGMVELDPCGIGVGSSGFREGQHITQATPGGGSRRIEPNLHVESIRRALSTPMQVAELQAEKECAETSADVALARHGTLLTAGAPSARNAAELKSLLGNVNARLKPKATVLPGPQSLGTSSVVALEQAKPAARVSLDILLTSPVGVQGSFLSGHIKIRVRRTPLAKESPSIMVASEGKVRVVGFECIPHNGAEERFIFYQLGGKLKGCVWREGEKGDEEGFGAAKEGIHVLPFRLFLPLEGKDGDAKGPLNAHGRVMVRYIFMASIKLKDPSTSKRSIAHFYRAVAIYPRLDPSFLLMPAARPLRATASRSLFCGGPGMLQLNAYLHRLHFIAGQRCTVRVHVTNGTRRTVRRATLALVRRTVLFRPQPHLDVGQGKGLSDPDPDACQTVTMTKVVAESTLEMGDEASRGFASARGWWGGVRAGESTSFEPFIQIPEEALSITRGRLLEVEYTLRVSLGARPLGKRCDVEVVLPIRIVNFLSVDPPHTWPLAPSTSAFTTASLPPQMKGGAYQAVGLGKRARISVENLFPSQEREHDGFQRILGTIPKQYPLGPVQQHSLGEIRGPVDLYPEALEGTHDANSSVYLASSHERGFGEDVEIDEANEVDNSYQYEGWMPSRRIIEEDIRSPASFADLYYTSVQEGLSESATQLQDQELRRSDRSPPRRPPVALRLPTFTSRVREKMDNILGPVPLAESTMPPLVNVAETPEQSLQVNSSARERGLAVPAEAAMAECPNTISELTRMHLTPLISQHEHENAVRHDSKREHTSSDHGPVKNSAAGHCVDPKEDSDGDVEYINSGAVEFHEDHEHELSMTFEEGEGGEGGERGEEGESEEDGTLGQIYPLISHTRGAGHVRSNIAPTCSKPPSSFSSSVIAQRAYTEPGPLRSQPSRRRDDVVSALPLRDLPLRPAGLGDMVGGSTGSVKERVMELEARARREESWVANACR